MAPASSTRDVRPKLRVVSRQPRPVPDATLSEATLIDAVVAGDGSVSGQLYDRLLHVVDRTLYRVLGRREPDHEDLVQASFEQIIKTLATRRFARACSLKTWAASIATNVGLNALRSRRCERQLVDRTDSAEAAAASRATHDNPERDAALRREIAELRQHLVEMTRERAETFLLHEVLGYDLAEIAALTGVSIAAAQSRLVRGRKELLSRLACAHRNGVGDER